MNEEDKFVKSHVFLSNEDKLVQLLSLSLVAAIVDKKKGEQERYRKTPISCKMEKIKPLLRKKLCWTPS